MPWYTLYTRTLTNNGTWGDRTIRAVATVATYDAGAPATATQLRVTIRSGTGGSASWTYIYVGHAAVSGDAYDFDGTQVQLLWSGSASGSITTADTSLTSDAVSYAFDKTKPLVISAYVPGPANSTNLRSDFGSGVAGFSRNINASGDQAATTDVTGYTTSSSRLEGFPQVEVFDLTSSGNVVLSAAAGSYAITGAAAGLGPGYQLTGFPATFVTGGGAVTLTAAAGSYALTGSAAALVYSATITAAAGSYALTGSAIGLGLGYKLTGSAAAFVVGVAGVTTLPAAAGSYALTGTAAGFLTPFNLPAAAGAYTLTGSDATLRVSGNFVLSAAAGSYTLTGTAAAFIPPGPVEPTTPGGVASVSRGRMIRKRRKREEQEEPIPVIGSTPVAEVPPGPSLPPQPGLMAHMPPVQPAKIPKRADPDEDEDEIALLLELIS